MSCGSRGPLPTVGHYKLGEGGVRQIVHIHVLINNAGHLHKSNPSPLVGPLIIRLLRADAESACVADCWHGSRRGRNGLLWCLPICMSSSPRVFKCRFICVAAVIEMRIVRTNCNFTVLLFKNDTKVLRRHVSKLSVAGSKHIEPGSNMCESCNKPKINDWIIKNYQLLTFHTKLV